MVYGSIYDIPEEIGPVDVATFGCILLHLQNPFRALERAARLVKDTLIITEHDCQWHSPRIALGQSAPPAEGFRRWLLQKIHALLGDPTWMRREYISSSLDELPLMMFLPNSQLKRAGRYLVVHAAGCSLPNARCTRFPRIDRDLPHGNSQR